MSLAPQIDTIIGELNTAKRHLALFDSGTKVAATRARSSLGEVTKQVGILRREILAQGKAMPVKARVGKGAETKGEEDPLPPPPKLKRQDAQDGSDPMDLALPGGEEKKDAPAKKEPREEKKSRRRAAAKK